MLGAAGSCLVSSGEGAGTNASYDDHLSHLRAGGQCKRTNIGIALVSDPRVLFLDEPTSGLDSYTANEVRAARPQLPSGDFGH